MSTVSTLDEKLANMLEETLTIFRLVFFPQAKLVLEKILDTKEKRVVYQNSDGKTAREIARIAGDGVTLNAVMKLWKEWIIHGIGKTEGTKGGGKRFIRNLSLFTFGLN